MNCDHCGHALAGPASKFCPECGTRLADPAPSRQTEIRVSQQVGEGSATGLKVGQLQADVVHIHVERVTPELVEQLRQVRTELQPRGTSGDVADRAQLEAVEAQGRELIEQMRTAERAGGQVAGVQVGDVRISRVAVLLKEAVLLRTDADQMFLDQLHDSRDSACSRTFDLDLGDMLDGFDATAHAAKLREAYTLLEEANRLEPANAEVLLHMAQIRDEVDDDPAVMRRLLFRVQRLLDPPATDTDRFHLAQAKFLLAVSGDHVHTAELRAARDMFAQLGRTDWVDHCNSLLHPAGHATHIGPTAAPAAFQPVGRWHAQISNGGAFAVDMLPDGSMYGVQQAGMMQVRFNGLWQFDPHSRLLQLQGLVNGFTPFQLMISVQGAEPGAFRAAGTDGLEYVFLAQP